jgi:hypothetical protein
MYSQHYQYIPLLCLGLRMKEVNKKKKNLPSLLAASIEKEKN